MSQPYVRCAHTIGNRIQECILVAAADRIACIPIAPAENAIGKIAGGIAMAGAGIVKIRLGNREIDVSHLATVADLDAAIAGTGGFYLGGDWTYRTDLPVIGTMLKHGGSVITTRERVPPPWFARLTPDRAPPSTKALKIFLAIGAAIVAGAVIGYVASGNLAVLFGVGFWGVLFIGTALFAWSRARRRQQPAG